jgi:asparagine synthase (glutamine-hydrolysing)
MLGQVAAYSVNSYRTGTRDSAQVPPWVSPQLNKIADAQAGYPPFPGLRSGFSPSSINNGLTWWLMLETLPHLYPSALSSREYRYPYLDRDLVDFLFRIPREQLVRPGRRRALMRRALVGIVPNEVLERRRKASLIRGPLVSLQRGQKAIEAIFDTSLVGAMGFVDQRCLKDTLAVINRGTAPKWWPAIIKAMSFEFWLQGQRGVLKDIPARVSEA